MLAAPMRGIPSRTPPSGGFRTPTTPGSSRFGGQHPLGGTPLGQKASKREIGIKVSAHTFVVSLWDPEFCILQ